MKAATFGLILILTIGCDVADAQRGNGPGPLDEGQERLQPFELVVAFASLGAMGLIAFFVFWISFRRFYFHARPGRVLLRTGGGPPGISWDGGILAVIPFQNVHYVYAEAMTLDCEGQAIVVQVGRDAEKVIRAFQAFGTREPYEIKAMLDAVAQSADGKEALIEKLGEIGYRAI